MGKLLLKHIKFQRTILFIEGEHFEDIKSEEFCLYNRNVDPETEEVTKTFIPITNAIIHGKTFRLEIPTLACNNEAPLYTGKWYLCLKKADNSLIKSYVTDDLYDKLYQYVLSDCEMNLAVNKSASNYYHVFSRLKEPKFIFYLDVNYRVPQKTRNILKIWWTNVKRRHSARLRVVRKGIFSYMFRFFNRIIKKTGNKVLFTSDSREVIGGNEEFIYNRMIERGMGDKYKFRFCFKERIGANRPFKEKFLFTYHLATSDYIFLDDYQPEIYLNEYDDSVKIVQVWHACGAFKTLGFERLGKKGSPPFNTKVHKCYTHVPVSSVHSMKHHAEAFAVDESKFYPVGIPRTDVFFDDDYKKEASEKIYDEFPSVKSASQVILYAPTFRGENSKNAYFPMHVLHLNKIGEYLKRNDAVMIIKMHPFVKTPLEIPEEYSNFFIDASEYREVNDILFVSDLLITDYSSVIYEMSLLDKPMLFYAFDLKQYEAERGFYEPFNHIVPGKIVKTLPALLKAIEEQDFEREKLHGFVEKNFKYTDGKATDRVIDLVFEDKV